jgi:hypothetical protein
LSFDEPFSEEELDFAIAQLLVAKGKATFELERYCMHMEEDGS